MADDGYLLSGDDVAILREIVSAYRRGDLGRPLQPARRALPPRCDVIFGKADTAIEATSGDNPGSGTLNVYTFTTDGTTDSGRDETVRNLSSVARTTAEFTVCVRDYESGQYMATGGSGTGYRHLCRFELDAALATSDPSAAALLTNSYGDGTAHSTGAITVYNLPTGTTNVYVFEGSSGNAGLAFYDSGTDWRIIQMECT